MIFNNNQINDVLSIMRRWQSIFIAEQIGVDFLSEAERSLLVSSGINLENYKNKKGKIEQAFVFGILSEALGDKRAKDMNYVQFKKFIESDNFIPLTDTEEFALNQLKTRAYTDISGLGYRIQNGVTNVIVKSNLKQQNLIRKVVKKEAIKASEMRLSATNLASDLGHATEDWQRDWLRIAYYLMHEAFNTGRAQTIFRDYGEDAEVYFDVFPGACKKCKELYLENPEDENSEPKVFKLKDIIANGNNIGRNQADWLPTVNPTHPYCRCIINVKKKGYEWNPDLRAFTIPVKIKSKNPKLKNVKYNIKISK